MITKQNIWRENRRLSGHEAPEWLNICEYPNCSKVTEFKMDGVTPMCSEHHSVYLFVKTHFVARDEL